MNAVPTIPLACAGNASVAGEPLPAINSAADWSTTLLAPVFPQLLDDLLGPDTVQNPKPDKKQAGQEPASGLMAVVAAPVPATLPAPPVRLILPAQLSVDTCGLAPQAIDESEIPAASGPAPDPDAPVAEPAEPSAEPLSTSPTAGSGEQIAIAAASDADAAPALILPPGMQPITPDEAGITAAMASSDAPTIPVAGTIAEAAPVMDTGASQANGPASAADEKPAAVSTGTPSAPNPAAAPAEFWGPVLSFTPPPQAARAAASNRSARPAPEWTRLAARTDEAVPPPSAGAPSFTAHAASRLELAFAVRLSAVEKTAAKQDIPQAGWLPPIKPGLSRPESPSPAPSARFGAGNDAREPHPDIRPGVDAPTPRPAYRLPEESGARRPDPTPLLHNPGEFGVEFSTPAPVSREGTATLAAGPHRTGAETPPEPGQPSPLAAPPQPARDIRLQVHGGEQRVDVRLTERAGEVQVAVRTPDARLTEALRSDLPGLSARLEQSGFRAETWHPAALRVEHHGFSPDTASSGSAPQGQTGQRHGNPQDREQQPPPHAREGSTGSEAPPQEFSWLFSSLR